MNFLQLLIDAASSGELTGDDLVASLRQQITDNQASDEPVDLTELEANAVTQFAERYNGGEYDPADTATLEALDVVVSAVRAEIEVADTARAELDERVQGLANRVLPQNSDPEGDPDGDGQEGEPDDGEPEEGGGQGGGTGAPDGGEGDEPEEGGDPAPTGERELVNAGRRRTNPPNARQIARQRSNGGQPRRTTAKRKLVITAAADVPQTPAGSKLTLRQLAEAAIRKFQQMPLGAANTYVRQSLAVIKRDTHESLVASGDRRDVELIDRIANERNLDGGSLHEATRRAITAAAQTGTFTYGGMWCAPSETDYTLCPQLATEAGMWDAPTMTVTHGGIRYPVTDEYPDLGYDEFFREYDENHVFDPAQPDSLKPCIEGFCPDWREARLMARPLCIVGDILRERGYPELTERFVSDVLLKHAHWMNASYLAYVAKYSDPVTPFNVSTGVGGIGSASYGVADRVSLLVTWFRNLYRMGDNDTLEGVAPVWFKEFLKTDIAKRSNRSTTAVSDAEVNAIFLQANSRVQWVYDWQADAMGVAKVAVPNPDAALPGQPATIDKWMPPAAWPTEVTMMFYPAGSWVLGQQDIVTLDAIYDSTQLRQNKYTRLFTEDAYLLLNRCNRSFKIQLTGLCNNGAVGPFRDSCPPAVPAAPGSSEENPLFTSEVPAA
jgi:hypothetical protein